MSSRIIHSNQSLVLQKVTKQSAGVYRCSVVNSEGETVSDDLNFRVQCKFFPEKSSFAGKGAPSHNRETDFPKDTVIFNFVYKQDLSGAVIFFGLQCETERGLFNMQMSFRKET